MPDHRITVREFILDVDEEVAPGRTQRITTFVRMSYSSRLSEEDHQRWSVEVGNGSFGWSWCCTEHKAQQHFRDEVRKLRAEQHRANAAGHFAESRFTVGSIVEDGECR